MDTAEPFERAAAAIPTGPRWRHELLAATRATGLVRRFAWRRDRRQFLGLQTGTANEFSRSLPPRVPKPLFGRHGFGLVRGTNRQQGIAQIKRDPPGKRLATAGRRQRPGHG